MSEFVIKDSADNPIVDWRQWTRPKRDYHWRAGRSAMELARAWFVSPVPRCPQEVQELLASHESTSTLTLLKAVPEHVTSLPERGEGRNHDLLILARGETGNVLLSVEAKVDEAFGETTIGPYWSSAKQSTSPTKVPQRIEALLSMCFGSDAKPDSSPWKELRYQLLTAVAGAAIEATRHKADIAVVIVHEFRTENLNIENLAANSEALKAFIDQFVPGSPGEITPGRLYGPVTLPAGEHLKQDVKILIGKAVYDWRLTPSRT